MDKALIRNIAIFVATFVAAVVLYEVGYDQGYGERQVDDSRQDMSGSICPYLKKSAEESNSWAARLKYEEACL
jgi:hypothetical protein